MQRPRQASTRVAKSPTVASFQYILTARRSTSTTNSATTGFGTRRATARSIDAIESHIRLSISSNDLDSSGVASGIILIRFILSTGRRSSIWRGKTGPGTEERPPAPQHLRHGASNGQPLVQLPRLVDAHADQEDDKVALDPARDAACDDVGYGASPMDTPREQSARLRNVDDRGKPAMTIGR